MSPLLIFHNVTCGIHEIAISHVSIFLPPCHMSFSLMLLVDFKKSSCCRVDFVVRGIGEISGLRIDKGFQ